MLRSDATQEKKSASSSETDLVHFILPRHAPDTRDQALDSDCVLDRYYSQAPPLHQDQDTDSRNWSDSDTQMTVSAVA